MANSHEINNFIPYTTDMYHFENTFDGTAFLNWTQENWTSSFWYCLFYLMLVFGGRHYMSKKPRFEIRIPLVIWSSTLAIFSIMGAIRTIPELLFMIRVNGFDGSVCDPSYFYGPTGIWAYLFTISKLYELGDTAFIILRKQPLIFLHWYHHVTVFIYVWFSYTDHTAPGRWFMVMNFTVHAFMYTYYALRAMKFRLHKSVNMFITTLQIAQMLMGVIVIVLAYKYKTQGHYCQLTWENMRYCSIMYTSYLLLFAYFFYNAYLKPKTPVVKLESSVKAVNHVNGITTNIKGDFVNGSSNEVNNSIVMNGSVKKLN